MVNDRKEIKKQEIEMVKARCIQDVGMSVHYRGITYSFNNKKWTECPVIVYTRNIRSLELFKKEELKAKSSTISKVGK